MATITRYPLFSHLRAEPNQHILHFSGGRLARQGVGLAYWFSPLSAAVAQVPAEDCTATFVLNERTADFQPVAAQCTVVYRFKNPESAAARLNFTLELKTGDWSDDPLSKVTLLWSQSARTAVREYLARTPVVDAVRNGPAALGTSLRDHLSKDPAPAEIGIALVSVQIDHIAPTPEVQKALETPTRESIQQKADEAVFQRRALAVEKERAIKQNELETQVDLAKRQDELIRQEGSNRLREVESAATAEHAKLQAEVSRREMSVESAANARRKEAQAEADAMRTRQSSAGAEAEAVRILGEANASSLRAQLDAEVEAETRKLAAWKELPPEIAMALGIKAVGEKFTTIGDVHLTPDLLGQLGAWLGKSKPDKKNRADS